MEAWRALETFAAANAAIITTISLIVGLIGIVLAVIFYRLAKPTRRLSFATRTFRIVTKRVARVPGIVVTYHDNPVPAVSLTRLAIWNAGSEPVRLHDIPEREPLRLATREGVTILAIDVAEETREANQITLVSGDSASQYAVKFDFLEPGDGALLNIIHDGTGREDVFLTGRIVGGSVRRTASLQETYSEKTGEPKDVVGGKQARFAAIVFSATGIAVSLLALINGRLAVGALLAVVMIPMGLGLYAYTRRTFPPARIGEFDLDL